MINTQSFAFILPGPLHLFWTTGYYLLCQMQNRNKVVLIVNHQYKNNVDFRAIVDSLNIYDVVYLETDKGIFKRNKYFHKTFRELCLKYSPALIMQHSFFYPEDLYLIYWKKKLLDNCEIVSFQNARFSKQPRYEFYAKEVAAVERYRSSSVIKSRFLIKVYLRFSYFIKYLLQYKIIPLYLIGEKFRPYINSYTRKIDTSVESPIDAYCYYRENELSDIKSNLGSAHNYRLVDHPVQHSPEECIELVSKIEEEVEDIIILLPSYGDINARIQAEENEQVVIEDVASTWIKIIKRVLDKYNKRRVYIKLHPLQLKDRVWNSIIQRIGNKVDIKIINPGQSAERWILNSKVVLADVSSVVWWCGFFDMKHTYSFDLFGYKSGIEMKEIPNIIYIDDINKLDME